MNQRETGDLGQGSVGKLLLRLALPTITAQLVNALYNMVDRIYIGHIPVVGRTALTGVGVCMSLIMIISAFAALTAMGGATRASIFLGRGDRAGCGEDPGQLRHWCGVGGSDPDRGVSDF